MSYSDFDGYDEEFEEAVKLVVEAGKASASLLQRRLSIGYARAARLLDQLTEAGVIGEQDGSMPRNVMVNDAEKFLREFTPDKRPKVNDLADFPGQGTWEKKEGDDDEVFVLGKSLKDLGHIYLFTSPLCGVNELLKNMAEGFVQTYSPQSLKLILMDETATFGNSFNKCPQMLPPVVHDWEKMISALKWAMNEMENRMKMCLGEEVSGTEKYNVKSGFSAMPRIIIMLNRSGGTLDVDTDNIEAIQRLISVGHLVGIHLIVASPLLYKKTSRILTAFPTKIIFKTFSVTDADLLGTDDAFDLKQNEYLFIPPYGDIEKCRLSS